VRRADDDATAVVDAAATIIRGGIISIAIIIDAGTPAVVAAGIGIDAAMPTAAETIGVVTIVRDVVVVVVVVVGGASAPRGEDERHRWGGDHRWEEIL
jgi:hypothetical protein